MYDRGIKILGAWRGGHGDSDYIAPGDYVLIDNPIPRQISSNAQLAVRWFRGTNWYYLTYWEYLDQHKVKGYGYFMDGPSLYILCTIDVTPICVS